MKAVIFHAPGTISVEERPAPAIEAPGDAIVRVSLTAICGHDVLTYRGQRQREPGSIGHEIVGTVSAIGEGVGRLAAGQRVVSPASVSCGGCFYCKQGLLTACERLRFFGHHLPGAQAELVRVPNADAGLEPLPTDLEDEKAIFLADTLSGAYAGLQMADLKAGESVAVLGCGPTGLCAQLVARSMGAGQVFAIDRHAYRLAAAAKAGMVALDLDKADISASITAATGGRGVDLAVEAVGSAAALGQAAALVRPWGRLLSLGHGIEAEASFPIGRLTARHVRLIPASFPPAKNYIAPLAKMLAHGVIDPGPVASHVLPLTEAARGYELMANRQDGALKVLLRPA